MNSIQAMLYEPFRHWAYKNSIWFFGDPHFGDEDCRIMDGSWVSIEDQIRIINSVVPKNATLILLGDIGDPRYISEINAQYRVLIMGNHDKPSLKGYFNESFTGPLFISQKILLSHEPVYGIDFCLNIHGHDHGGIFRKDPYHLNVAANICNFTPVSLKDVIKSGYMSGIDDIHRIAIDKQKKNSLKKKEAMKRASYNDMQMFWDDCFLE